LGKVEREERTRGWLFILGAVVWVLALAAAIDSGSGGGVILVLVIGIVVALAFSRGEPGAGRARATPTGARKDESGRWVLREGTGRPLSEAERSALLDGEISDYAGEGFSVRQRTATTAQLVRPKKFSFFWAPVWFLMLGVGLVVYLLYYAAKRDEGRYVEVNEYGAVRATLQ
jgi:hypothetical protein